MSRHARLAQAAIEANNNRVAESELNALLKEDPGNADAHANLGMLKFVEADYLEASRQFRAALSRSPSLWSAQAFLGLCQARLGIPGGGRDLLEPAFPHLSDPTLIKQSGLELVRSYSDSGAIQKALPILDRLERLNPTDSEILYAEYRVHSEIASEALRHMTQSDGDSPWLHEVYGQNFMAQEQYPSAAGEFQKALELNPNLPGLRYQLGEALLLSEHTEAKRNAAEQEFRLELEKNPQDADCILKLAEIAIETSRLDLAKRLVAQALSIRPNLAAAHVAKARIMELEGNVPLAIKELEAAEKFAPDVKQTYYRLGTLYRREGRQKEAEGQFQVFQRLASAEPKPVRVDDKLQ